ncbi:MAG TPA: GGDEF domain-containing protein [Acidimicrobiales bacterium]
MRSVPGTARGRNELASLAWRLGSLQLTRLVMAALAVAAAASLPGYVPSTRPVVVTSLAFALLTSVLEAVRRRYRVRSLALLSSTLLLDGVWVAVVLSGGGGLFGPLGVLVHLHVVAVTVLLSWRTGLKVAVWHLLLQLVSAYDGFEWLNAGSGDERSLAFSGLAVVLLAAAAAWYSALNEQALRRGKAELAALVALTESLEVADTAGDIRAALLRHVTERLGFRRAALVDHTAAGAAGAVVDRRTSVLFESAVPIPPPALRHPSEAGVRTGTRGVRLVRTLDPDAASDRLADALLPAATNVVVVPLTVEGQLVATLYAEWGGHRRRVAAQTVAVLVQSCTHAAQSLRSERLRSEVEWLATRDPLTGVYNRAVFDERLTELVASAQRTERPLSLIVLDVDHFKAVNDGFGHQAGDGVLRVVGETLIANSRNDDVAARFGGDEFAVLLPGVAGPTALAVAERLRASISRDVPLGGITVSAGVATLPRRGGSPQQLLAAADVALYQSKRDGRDRSSRFEEPHVTLALPGA